MTDARFKAYPNYKDSGIEWLGEIPAHWDAISIKRVARIVNGATPRTGEPDYWNGDIAWATPDDLGHLGGDTLKDTSRHITRKGYESCGTSLVPGSSLVLSTRAPIGHLAIAGREMCMNQGCRGLVLSNTSPIEYRYYSLLAAKPVLQSCGQGSTFQELSRDSLGSVPVPNPSGGEQQAIANFLDRETGKIDALVEKKERLIELLREKRTALITHAVTRGLDPNVPMKDSGVEWLGQIPAHWDITRGRFLGRLLGSSAVSEDDLLEDGEGMLYAKVDDLNSAGSSLQLKTTKLRLRDASACHRCMLLFPKRGAAIFTNKVVIVDEASEFDSNLMGWEIRRGVNAKFVAYCLIARRLDDLADVSSIPQINNKHINPTRFPLPAKSEQLEIATYIDHETEKIDALIAKIQEAIERLKEYRTALISAAVTGKIDVRGM